MKLFKDWFLPSLYEMDAMFLILHQNGKGDFNAVSGHYYWLSTEASSTNANSFSFYDESVASKAKSTTTNMHIRPIRTFLSNKLYELMDPGEGKGLIFHRIPEGNAFRYYEAYLSDIGGEDPWSNITDSLADAFGTDIGTGSENTDLIIGQEDHESSAAFTCRELEVVLDWCVKYQIEWTDILGLAWRIEISEDDIGEFIPESIQAADDPLIIDWLSGSLDLLKDPIKGSIATFRIYSETNFNWLRFQDYKGLKYQVKIYSDESDLYWQGFINSAGYIEPYDGTAYPVILTASDGLGLLKQIRFNDNGTPYNGRQTICQILLDIFEKISFSSFREYCNIYSSEMANNEIYSPFTQCYIDYDVWKDDSFCYEVLQDILKSFGAFIRQYKGEFYIIRPKELLNYPDNDIYGRKIIKGGSTVEYSLNLNSDYLKLKRISQGDDTPLIDFEGGSLSFQDPACKITLNQDYGSKESWIDNFKFEASMVDMFIDETLNQADFWTKTADTILYHVSFFMPEETNGIMLGWTGDNSAYITQIFGSSSKATENGFMIIDLWFNWFNYHNTSEAATNISITIKQGSKYLVILDDTYAEWSDSVLPLFSYTPNDIYGTSDVPPYFGDGWINFKRKFYVLPGDGDIEISLAANGYSDIYNCFKDIKFYATNYKILQKTIKRKLRQRIIWNSGTGGSFLDLRNKYYTVKYKEEIEPIVENIIERTNIDSGIDLPFDFKIGDVTKESDPVYSGDTAIDNIVEQFAGSLAYNDGVNAQQSVLIGGSGAGTLEIIIDGITKNLVRGVGQSIEDAIDSFMYDYEADYLENAIVLIRATVTLFFTKIFKGVAFDGDLDVNVISGDITGMILTATDPANDFVYTTSWETFQNGENKPLLEIIADELMELNIRPKQILQLPFNEFMDVYGYIYPEFHVNGFLEDSLNKDDSDTNRRYMIISASFNVRDRSWNCDLWELIRKPEIPD